MLDLYDLEIKEHEITNIVSTLWRLQNETFNSTYKRSTSNISRSLQLSLKYADSQYLIMLMRLCKLKRNCSP